MCGYMTHRFTDINMRFMESVLVSTLTYMLLTPVILNSFTLIKPNPGILLVNIVKWLAGFPMFYCGQHLTVINTAVAEQRFNSLAMLHSDIDAINY